MIENWGPNEDRYRSDPGPGPSAAMGSCDGEGTISRRGIPTEKAQEKKGRAGKYVRMLCVQGGQ